MLLFLKSAQHLCLIHLNICTRAEDAPVLQNSVQMFWESGRVFKKYRGKMDNIYKQYADDCLKNVGKIDTSRIVVADSGGVSGEIISYTMGLIAGKAKFDEIIRADAGCTISSHCGPKTLAIFYIKK